MVLVIRVVLHDYWLPGQVGCQVLVLGRTVPEAPLALLVSSAS